MIGDSAIGWFAIGEQNRSGYGKGGASVSESELYTATGQDERVDNLVESDAGIGDVQGSDT